MKAKTICFDYQFCHKFSKKKKKRSHIQSQSPSVAKYIEGFSIPVFLLMSVSSCLCTRRQKGFLYSKMNVRRACLREFSMKDKISKGSPLLVMGVY